MRWLAVLILALGATATAAAARGGDGGRCAETATRALADVGITKDQVASMKIIPDTAGGQGLTVYSVTAWIKLVGKEDQGSVQVVMSPACSFNSIYTSGKLSLPGVDQY